jgi:hypothetical protein
VKREGPGEDPAGIRPEHGTARPLPVSAYPAGRRYLLPYYPGLEGMLQQVG